jgi:23S rRNA G2069 N7-methylase RlmK/C1962 C5-methylase RlmI
MIATSSIESGVTAQMVEFRTQGKDHATIITSDEGLYLKVAVLRVI